MSLSHDNSALKPRITVQLCQHQGPLFDPAWLSGSIGATVCLFIVFVSLVQIAVVPAIREAEWKGAVAYGSLGLCLAFAGVILIKHRRASKRLDEYVRTTEADVSSDPAHELENPTTVHLVSDARQLMLVEQLMSDNPGPSAFSPYISSGAIALLWAWGSVGFGLKLVFDYPSWVLAAVTFGIVGYGLVGKWIRRTRISLDDGVVTVHTLESDLKYDHRQLRLAESDVYTDFSRMELCVDDHKAATASVGLLGYNRPHALVASILSHRSISKSDLRQAIAAAHLKNPKPKRVA